MHCSLYTRSLKCFLTCAAMRGLVRRRDRPYEPGCTRIIGFNCPIFACFGWEEGCPYSKTHEVYAANPSWSIYVYFVWNCLNILDVEEGRVLDTGKEYRYCKLRWGWVCRMSAVLSHARKPNCGMSCQDDRRPLLLLLVTDPSCCIIESQIW